MLLRAARFLGGLVAGAVLLAYVSPAYNRYVASATGALLRFDSRFSDAQISVPGHWMVVHSPGGRFPGGTRLPVSQLTYNVIFLIALFASNDHPLRARNLTAMFLSLLVVAAFHPVGAFLTAESTFANRVEGWSDAHYGAVARSAWLVAEMFYRLIGMFAIAFICWWLSGRPPEGPEPSPRRRRPPGRR